MILGKSFQTLNINSNVACVFVLCSLYFVEVCSDTINLLRIFIGYCKGYCIFSNDLSTCIEIIMIFIFHFVNVVDHVYWLVCIEQPLPPGNKFHLIMSYCLFNMLSNLDWQYFVENFASVFFRHACMHIQSCLTLCDPMDFSQPGSSVHGIFQAKKLEWVAISFSSIQQGY